MNTLTWIDDGPSHSYTEGGEFDISLVEGSWWADELPTREAAKGACEKKGE